MLRLHDTASGRVAELEPRDPGAIGIYVCGPTVYGPPHVGHGRFALVYDVLRRYLTYLGFAVRYVSNITDIDDKIIDRAQREGRDWRAVAAECEAQWWSAMDALGVLRPTESPRATAYVEEMVELIAGLVARGAAYETDDGVYLEVATVPDYGQLAHQSLESLRAGARVELAEHKRSPADFALWKKAKPGEPTWPSPWGPGRPGWHTECVVMSLALLGESFDLHGGGQDLIFPHHENERAQAVASGRRFARHWMHNGFVVAGGEKMSKSLGNFTTLEELLASHEGRAYRLLVLRAHYRSPVEVSPATLEDAARALARLDDLARRFADREPAPPGAAEEELSARFAARMDDDLDTPGALAELFEALRAAHALADAGDGRAGAALARRVLELFAVLGLSPAPVLEEPGAEELELAALRDIARRSRDFTRADALRAELEARGWRVEDTPEGTRVRR